MEGSLKSTPNADEDGDLDLLVTGEQGFSPSATLYENDGDGNFSEAGDAGLAGRQQSAAAIGDIDGDGAPDLVIAGLDGSLEPSTTLYENDGDGTFSAVGDAGLPDVNPAGAGLDVADVDDDGDLDLILTGEDENNNDIATLYENQGDGSFVEAGESLKGIGSARFADVNGDGAPDLLISGFTDGKEYEVATLYENDGEGSFSEVDAGIEDVDGRSGFADFDLDGDLDLVITENHVYGVESGTTLYKNDGQGNFSVLESNVSGVSGGSLSIGDVDGDNDPDLLLTGKDPFFDASTRLYVNRTNQEPPNRAPQLGRSLSLGATAAGLSASTTVEIGDPDGDAVSLSLTQDGSDAGASFSDEGGGFGAFAFSPNRNDAGTEVPFTVEASDGDGETASFSFSVSVPSVFAAADAGLMPLNYSSSDFGDVDGNGTQELVVTGRDSSNTERALLYEYDGRGGYAPMEAGFEGVEDGSSDFADIDNDGDLDLLVTGGDDLSNPTATLYENDGDGNFSEPSTDIDGVQSGTDAAFGDVDDDGDLDLVVIGNDDNLDPTATLYLNDGTGSFSKAGESLEAVANGAAKFEDVDDDGDLDLLLVGEGSSGDVATIYENDGTGAFSDMGASLDGAERSSAAFGDVEGDGDSDLVIAGRVSFNPSISLYTNDGDGTFTEHSIGAAPLDRAAVEFGDVDDDGDLDLLAAGENED
ncbi:MAG: hypothetical protein BRD30_13315, partial [Bacteroidetes bacterium QH_2_63_10]